MQVNRKNIGQMLIWLGVSTWIPYFYFLFFGSAKPLYIFLPIHLIFVISGVRLKKSSVDKTIKPKKFSQLSQILLYIGMAAWLPYFYVHYYYQLDIGHIPFLVLHLFGMLGGGFLRII